MITNNLRLGVISTETLGVPESQFLGDQTGVPINRSRDHQRGPAGGDVSGLVSQAQPSIPRDQAKINHKLPQAMKKVMQPLLKAHQSITIPAIMNADRPPLQYPSITVGNRGACLNSALLGYCNQKNCRYKHEQTEVPRERVPVILDLMQPYIEAYCQEAAREKRTKTSDLPVS
jgi:hypothetical protein